MKKFLSILLFILITFGCSSVKPTAVIEFSKLTEKTTEQYSSIANDYYESCKRRSIYEIETPDCNKFSNTRNNLLKIYKLIEDYISLLGKIADNNITVYDKELDSLEKELESTKLFKEEEITTINSFTKYLLNAISLEYKNDKLSELIGNTNKDFGIIISRLIIIIKEEYILTITLERTALTNYYKTLINKNPNEKIGEFLINQQLKKDIEFFNKKEKEANILMENFEKIKLGHQELFKQKNNLSSKELLKKILTYSLEIKKNIEKITTTF